MGLSPLLWVLYLGRIFAGLTGANMAVATAYIADISGPDERSRRFGYMNACFGLGFIAGPLLGGLVGSLSPRYPFLLAALFNGLNLLLGFFALPESHPTGRGETEPRPRNLFAPLLSIRGNRTLLPLLTIYFMIHLIGQIPGSLWIVHGEDRFGWDIWMVGLTFAAFGILHAIAQAFFTGPATHHLGERGAIILGVVSDSLAFIAMALVTKGWMVFPILILFTAGGIAMPAFQSLLSRQVERGASGRAAGDAGSILSLTEVVGPIAATSIYAGLTRFGTRPGLDRGCRTLPAVLPRHHEPDVGLSGKVDGLGRICLTARVDRRGDVSWRAGCGQEDTLSIRATYRIDGSVISIGGFADLWRHGPRVLEAGIADEPYEDLARSRQAGSRRNSLNA